MQRFRYTPEALHMQGPEDTLALESFHLTLNRTGSIANTQPPGLAACAHEALTTGRGFAASGKKVVLRTALLCLAWSSQGVAQLTESEPPEEKAKPGDFDPIRAPTDGDNPAPPAAVGETEFSAGLTVEPPRAASPLGVEYPVGEVGQAVVSLELLIDIRGRVAEARVLEGDVPWSQAALDAVATWRFFPARKGKQAVAARIRMQVRFEPPVPEEASAVSPSLKTTQSPEEAAPNSEPDAAQALEVVVEGERPVGVRSLGRAEVRQMPGAFGDPYRAIESLPGVTPIASGLPYFFVRGAPPGNVGYFFDDMSVPLLYHGAAGPGVIHPAFIRSVDLYSGGYPAKYGRYAGGIVAGELARPEGKLRGEASIRLLDAGGFVESPFGGGRGSVMLGGRYSYTGLVVSALAPDVTLGYWDYQALMDYQLSSRESVSLFGFGSHDFLSVDERGREVDLLDLTFHRLKAGYARELSSGAALKAALTFGHDRTGLGDREESDNPAELISRRFGAQAALEQRLTSKLLLRSGADIHWDSMRIDLDIGGDEETFEADVSPEEVGDGVEMDSVPEVGPSQEPLSNQDSEPGPDSLDAFSFSRDDLTSGAWVELVWNPTADVTITPGLRLDLYDTDGTVRVAVEPRIGARFDISKGFSLVHSFGIAHQPPSFVVPIPGLSGSASTGLQQAFQSSAGVELQLPLKLTGSATLFQNVILNSTDILSTINLDVESAPGDDGPAFNQRTTSHSYGLELYLRRSLSEKLGGFLSYTLSRSLRSVGNASGLSSFDRTHVLNFALAYDLGRRWRLGTRLVTYSGVPAEVAYAAAAKNPPRASAFYRVDFRLEKRWLIGAEGAWWAFVLEVLNTTLNKEVVGGASCYAYGCEEREIGPVTLPSIGVEASF